MLLLLCFPTSDAAFVSRKTWSPFVSITSPHPSSAQIYRPSVHLLSSKQSGTSVTRSSATVNTSMDRPQAQQILADILCPPSEERDRNSAGMQAFTSAADDYRGRAIESNDPRNEYTYDEFPCDSFDLLVDRALELMEQEGTIISDDMGRKEKIMVDLGSGCGRLVLYAALTRGNGVNAQHVLNDRYEPWSFCGIEIGSQLHSLAVNSLQRGVDNGWFCEDSNSSGNLEANVGNDTTSKIKFLNGNALLVDDPYFPTLSSDGDDHERLTRTSIQSILSQTSLLFAYSTVWETDPSRPFDPDVQAMILSPKWSRTLAALCPNGCVAVTTDRALNPRDGWKLLESMDVENPSVWGSVGYVSVLENNEKKVSAICNIPF